MTAQLTVHNAEIYTATVQVKTLTISGKQVTLAVFRQLRDESLIAEDGTLNGLPWGTVNYHPDKCASDRDVHWHIVWQQGDELRRSQVSVKYTAPPVFWSKSLAHEYAACVHHWLITGESRYWHGGVFKLFSGNLEDSYGLKITSAHAREQWLKHAGDIVFTNKETDIRVGFDIPQEVKAAVLARSGVLGVQEDLDRAKGRVAGAEKYLEEAMQYLSAAEGTDAPHPPTNHSDSCSCDTCLCTDPAKAKDRVHLAERLLKREMEVIQKHSSELAKVAESAAIGALGNRYATEPLDRLRAAYIDELNTEAERRKRHADIHEAIVDLPQLFIAV